MRAYFNRDNCDFTDEQIEQANECVASLLAEWGDPNGENPQNVQNACDRANDFLPE